MKFVPVLTAFLIAGTASTAGAAVTFRSVAVENHSFEQGVLGDGQYFRTSIPGWSASGSGVGYFNPPAGAGFDATDGQNVVDIDVFRHSNEVGDSTYTQVLSEVIAAGTTYELSIDAIRRPDIDIGPWAAEIFSIPTGANQGGTTLATGTLGNADIAPGGAKTLTFRYLAGAADAGLQLGIRFRSIYTADQTPFRQVLIDNVRMTAASDITAAVPEPATWAMMLVGFGMIGVSARRRTRVAAVIA